MTEVTSMRQTQKQSVKDYVAAGRESLVRLREVGIKDPSSLVLPCFRNGIDSRMKQQVLPFLNQERFDSDVELLAQEFQRITIGMAGASGAEGHASTSRSWSPRPRKKQRGDQGCVTRTCYVCGEKRHIARARPQKKAGEDRKGPRAPSKGPMVFMSAGDALSSNEKDSLLFDSGATHHIICKPTYLRNRRYSGEESHPVKGGDLLIYIHDTDMEVLMTAVLFVPSLNCNLCSGTQMTAKGVVCEEMGAALIVKCRNGSPVLSGTRQDNLYYIN
jgi:hypothetical protein